MKLELFATTPKGLELLLVEELRHLGAENPREKLAGVSFTGDLALAYKACLWSRLANRILLPLAQFPAKTPEELYLGVKQILWDEHVDAEGTLLVNCVSSQSAISHTLFAAQKVKDAIVDQFREKYQVRPSVSNQNPDICVNVYLHRDVAIISLDLSGESLHKRGLRVETGEAPLKENLAAAILLRAGWLNISKNNGMLLDPMCGSGTLLIEAALMAGDIAPGLTREYFGFLNWKQHDTKLWDTLVSEAATRREAGLASIPMIAGFDVSSQAIKIAHANIARANLQKYIHVEKRDLTIPFSKKEVTPGLVVVNPPYGERLGEIAELKELYARLGEKLKTEFLGWQAAVLTGNPDLGKYMGLRATKYYALFNGLIPCKLLLFDVQAEKFVDQSIAAENERRIRKAQRLLQSTDSQAITMFVNRLHKKLKHFKREISAIRDGAEQSLCVYDADLPEYAVSIDIFSDHVLVQEYPAPRSINKEIAATRLQHILAVLPEALEIAPGKIFFGMHERK